MYGPNVRRIENNCFGDACVGRVRLMREKRVFGGPRKSSFSGITFFFLDLVESGQSNVCSASNARNFGTKFVGIEALWPRFCPDRKKTLAWTHENWCKSIAQVTNPLNLNHLQLQILLVLAQEPEQHHNNICCAAAVISYNNRINYGNQLIVVMKLSALIVSNKVTSLQALLRKAFRSPGVLVLGDFGSRHFLLNNNNLTTSFHYDN